MAFDEGRREQAPLSVELGFVVSRELASYLSDLATGDRNVPQTVVAPETRPADYKQLSRPR